MQETFPPRPSALQADEMRRRQAGRNRAVLIVLVLLVALFFAITLVKLAGY